MEAYKMAKGAVKASPHSQDVRLYGVVYQPYLPTHYDFYPLGIRIWEECDEGNIILDSLWAEEELAEARRRFIDESNGVGGFYLTDHRYTKVVEIRPAAEELYVLLEDE